MANLEIKGLNLFAEWFSNERRNIMVRAASYL